MMLILCRLGSLEFIDCQQIFERPMKEEEEADEIYNLEGQTVQKVTILSENKRGLPPYEVEIDKVDAQTVMKSDADTLSLKVVDSSNKQSWTINRKYSQFQWLFKALKAVYPGQTLPYFPSLTVQTYLTTKLTFVQTGLKTKFLAIRLQQLNAFIQAVSRHSIVGHSQEIKIFVYQNTEQFRRMKRNIDRQMEELNNTESTSISLFSIFQRGIAWISDAALGEVLQQNQTWNQIKIQANRYSEQLLTLLQKFYDLRNAKAKQIEWKGPETEIDSVEILKTKVRSGQQYNELLINEIQLKILHPLFEECKKQAQLAQQLTEKQDLERLIKYLKKFTGNEPRIQKLTRRKQSFDRNFKQCLNTIQSEWKGLADSIDFKFRKMWSEYCRNMLKIWK